MTGDIVVSAMCGAAAGAYFLLGLLLIRVLALWGPARDLFGEPMAVGLVVLLWPVVLLGVLVYALGLAVRRALRL